MRITENRLRKLLSIKSPSEEHRKICKKYFLNPFRKGIKQGQKDHKKYKKIRTKFERKWLKQNQTWNDTRQKRKALEKAFLKAYPQYTKYIQLERLGRKCKKI